MKRSDIFIPDELTGTLSFVKFSNVGPLSEQPDADSVNQGGKCLIVYTRWWQLHICYMHQLHLFQKKNREGKITDGNVILQVTSTVLLPGEPLLSHTLKRRKSQCVTENGWG